MQYARNERLVLCAFCHHVGALLPGHVVTSAMARTTWSAQWRADGVAVDGVVSRQHCHDI